MEGTPVPYQRAGGPANLPGALLQKLAGASWNN